MKKTDKTLVITFGIFGLIGILFTILGIIWISSAMKFQANAMPVNGVISRIETYRDSDGDRRHSVYVDYTYEGREYKNVLINTYSSSMYEGKEVELKVDPQHPGKVSLGAMELIGAIIFLVMGLVFASVGVIPVVNSIFKKAKKSQLKEEGKFLYGIVESIDWNTSLTVNGRHPYVVYCNYRDEYKDVTYRFKSDNLWSNPEPAIQPGMEIRIYVESDDYSNYHVDTESMTAGKIIDYT